MSSTRVRVGCVISSTRVAFSTRNPALLIYLFHIVNIMAADVLTTQGARASATLISIMLNKKIPENTFEIVVCKMAAILLRPQYMYVNIGEYHKLCIPTFRCGGVWRRGGPH